MLGKEYDFGVTTCFTVGKNQSKAHLSKKDDLAREKKRYTVISKQDDGSLFLEFYKDHASYMNKFKSKVKDEAVYRARWDSGQFCGITQGNIADRASKSDTKPNAPRVYMAFIFVDFTAMLMFSECDLKRLCLRDLEMKIGQSLGHIKSKPVTVESTPRLDQAVGLVAGRTVMMCLSKERLSLACRDNHHQCRRSWPLNAIRADVFTTDTILQIDIAEFGTYSFSSTRSSSIFEEVRTALWQLQKAKEQPITPDYVTKGPPLPMRRSSQTSLPSPPGLSSPSDPGAHGFPDIIRNHEQKDAGFYLPNNSDVDQFIAYLHDDDIYGDGEYNVDWNETIRELQRLRERTVEDVYLTTSTEQLLTQQQLPRSTFSLPHSAQQAALRDMRRHGSEPGIRDLSASTNSLPTGLGLRFDGPPFLGRRQSEYAIGSHRPMSTLSSKPGGGSYLIFRTMEKVLQGIPASKDTLQLSHSQRVQLCLRLYGPCIPAAGSSMESWELLAEEIGLRTDAIDLIAIVVRNHRLPIPAAEVVLRHWQYVYNKYGYTGRSGKCPYHCTRQQLIHILRERVQREDLVELLETSQRHSSS